MADAVRGVPDAATAYRQLAPAVLAYLRGQAAEDPEDLLGEVFLQVARDLRRFQGDETDLRRWVFSIARNRVIDAGRRRRRRPRALGPPPERPAPDQPPPIEPALLAALAELTDEQREVVVLRFIADLPSEEVAVIVDRPLTAVKALQRRAIARLQTLVSPELLG